VQHFRENAMNTIRMALTATAIVLVAGCTNVQRSRDLANPDVSGTTLAVQVCANCHGPTGNSVSPNFPNLAAQQQAYFVSQLTAFKAHSREDPAGFEYMWGLSRSLTEKQIGELAAYFAGNRLEQQPVEGTPERIAAGKSIFTDGIPANSVPACGSCHGPDGMGNGTFPRIAGQHADYLQKQLTVFQKTDQRPQGVVMKVVTHQLTPRNIADVAAYLQSMAGR
jgi:cytochrome c553